MSAPRIVVLTGSGISAESGVDTFRTEGGLWSRYDVSEIATPEGFAADPDKVHAFYDLRRAALPGVSPNPAHMACDAVLPWPGPMGTAARCPACARGGTLRPHVVWFGEMPRYLDEAEAALTRADLFVSIGTSGSVYPAAGMVHAARARGVRTMELNLEPSENADAFGEARYGLAGEIVPRWAEEVTW